MKYYLFLLPVIIIAACSSPRYYVVRHAEKSILTKDSADMMASNPPLSEAGKVRAFVLRDELKSKHIEHIYSTNTLRAVSTAEPLGKQSHVQIQYYSNVDSLIGILHATKGNVLIVGHSNTVDDIVNKLTGKKEIRGDLGDAEYDNLFIIKGKPGNGHLIRKKYGYPSNPE